MSYTEPEACSWYHTCQKFDCAGQNSSCLTVHISDGPNGNSHDINTTYTVSVAGIVIPVIRTVRKFNVTYSKKFGDPGRPEGLFVDANGNLSPLVCNEYPPNEPTCRVTEDCVMERSIIHYIDQRYGVCLYQYIKDDLKFDIISTEECLFKEPWQVSRRHQVKIKTTDVTCTRTEEWRLIIHGEEKILTTRTVGNMPFEGVSGGGSTEGNINSGGGLNQAGVGSGGASSGGTIRPFNPNYIYDPTVVQVLVFPQPPSMAIPWSDDIRAYGFYDYATPEGTESALNAADGGEKDMFYPQWCRALFTDPFWRYAADRRYMISWFHSDLATPAPDYTPVSYTPPAVYNSPLPRGTYVEHPIVGQVYQFLVNEAYGTYIETSPDFNKIIDAALAAGQATHDTTLYYPIGVV